MKKNYLFTLLFTFCFGLLSFGQGVETFTNSTATGSYSDGSFVGSGGITWSFVASRDAFGDNNNSGISLPALMLRRSSSDSRITSSTIAGGIGDFSVKLYKGFTGGGNRQVELFINGVSKGTSTAFDDFEEHIFTVANLNITGDIIIELKNITSKQIIIDDITWTVPSTAPSLTITSPLNNTVFPASTTTVPVEFSVTNFTFSADNGSGASDNSGDGYLKGTLVTPTGTFSENKFNASSKNIESLAGESFTVTYELVDNSGVSLTPKVEATTSFSIDFPCDIVLGDVSKICDVSTADLDTYNISIPFTGGNTSTYTLTTDSGTIGGDNPSAISEGVITISGVMEGTDVVFNLKGDVLNSNCDITENISSPICLPALTCPAVGALIITEIMQNPSSVDDDKGEYFEVYNTTDSAINLQGWTISTASSGTPVVSTISLPLSVPAKEYVILAENADINTNGGVVVDYQYDGSLFLGNGTASITLSCSSSVIDEVTYDGGTEFPDPNGKSMELATDKYSATDNDSGANWAEATSAIVSGGDLGTPGSVNSFVLSVNRNSILGFANFPNPITNNEFTITSSNSSKKDVAVFNVLGKNVLSSSFTGTKSTLDVSSISSGVYILKVTEDGKTATKKLVIR